ncbi:MAG: hypothetical protein K9I84_15455, partial [Leadbetterella sp.]|nr:hypothetical protein [Leadbetterella sp.]
MAQVVLKRTLKTLAILIFILLALAVGLILYFNSKPGQKRLSDFVTNFLSERLQTPVTGNISYGFPDWVNIENLLIRDQSLDTLLSAKRAYINVDMLAYLDNNLKINKLELEGSFLNIYKRDTVFNYEYALIAFSSNGPKDTTAIPVKYALETLLAKNLRVKYSDKKANQKLEAVFGDLNTGFSNIELHKNQFFLKNTSVKNVFLTANFGKSESEPSKSNGSSVFPDIQIKEFSTENFNWDLTFGSSKTKGSKFNLAVVLDKIDLPKSEVSVNSLAVNANRIMFLDTKSPKSVVGQINFQDINLTDLVFKASKIKYDKANLEGEISKLMAKEKSGFEIKELTAKSVYRNQRLVLSDLNLKTNNSALEARGEVVLNKANLAKSVFAFNLISSSLSASDVLFFNTNISQNAYLKNISKDNIILSGRIAGDISSVKLDKIFLRGIQNSSLAFSGTIKNFSDPFFDLNISKLASSKEDIERIVPSGVLPENINIPKDFVLSGTVKGKVADFMAN